MRLSKINLLLLAFVPIVFGFIILYSFGIALGKLFPLGMTTFLIYDQMVIIGVALFLGASAYWVTLVYHIYLMQENEVSIQRNLAMLAEKGTSHLESAKNLINRVLEDIKAAR